MNHYEHTSGDTVVGPVPRDHAVRFFEHDADFVHEVTRFVLDGLDAGDVVITLTTAAHAAAIDETLHLQAIDVDALVAAGRLVAIDADDVMARRLTDVRELVAEVATHIDAAIGTGRGVRVFGELVALLWNAAEVEAAIELEGQWNALRADRPFELLCAYSTESLTGEDAAWFSDVCAMHASLLAEDALPVASDDAPRVADRAHARTFPCDRRAPAAARRFVIAFLRQWGREALIEDAGLVCAELTTNAVLHAGSDFTVAVSRRGSAVRIAVRDASRRGPVMQRPDPTATSGRGLILVARLAKRWGIDVLGAGKVVWADLA